MNRISKKFLAFLMMTAIACFAAQTVFAQETEEDLDFEDEIEAINEEAEDNPEQLLLKLSIEFEVEVAVLEGLIAEGYSPGQVWLALEIADYSQISLEEAVLMTDAQDGHGWGNLAQVLGIVPGSEDFHALKLKWSAHQGSMIKEMKQEKLGGKPEDKPGKGEKPENPGNQDNGNKGKKK